MTILRQPAPRRGIWWEDSNFYDVYDDFGDASLDTSKWNSTIDGTGGTATVTESGGVLNMTISKGTSDTRRIRFRSIAIPSNKHIFVWGGFMVTGDSAAYECEIQIGNETDGYSSIVDVSGYRSEFRNSTGVSYLDNAILIVALGSNQYDAWFAGEKILSAITLTNGCQLRFTHNTNSTTGIGTLEAEFVIKEVRVSK